MTSSNENKSLFIDKEALATLAMIKEGIFLPVTTLMSESETQEVDDHGLYKGEKFPFSFVLAPSGKRNEKVLKEAKQGDRINLVEGDRVVGHIIKEEVFSINKEERAQKIYGTADISHPGVEDILKRLGSYAIYGAYDVEFSGIKKVKQQIENKKQEINAQNVAAIMLAAKPINRAHERLIRQTLAKNDLVVLFLLKPYKKDTIPYCLREKALSHYVNNFLPHHKVLIVPLENTYIFAGFHNIMLDAIAAKNYGCSRIVVGETHAGIGTYYQENRLRTITDFLAQYNIDIEIETVGEFVYCDKCTTLVTAKTCPHGAHHHIQYKSDSIEELLINGILPPAVLVRKEVSAIMLSELFPNRLKNINKIYTDLIPSKGMLEEHTDEELYLELIKLHQTNSLT